MLNKILMVLEDGSSVVDSGSGTGGTEGGLESLTEIFKNPTFWIVIGVIVLLIIVVYITRRFVKVTGGEWKIIERNGKLFKVLDQNNKSAFLVPFKDKVAAVITPGVKALNSDKLFINNGPDYLYKINYTMSYKINDPKVFYPLINGFDGYASEKINDDLRYYSDTNGAEVILKEFLAKKADIIEVLNKSFADKAIEVVDFKIKSIEPMGKK